MSPTPCILNRQQPSEWTSRGCFGYAAVRLLLLRPCHMPQERGSHKAEKPPKAKPGLPAAGGGHPRMEAKGLSTAVSDLLSPATSLLAAPKRSTNHGRTGKQQNHGPQPAKLPTAAIKTAPRSKSWARLEQALRVTDLLLQAGGFSCIVLDMGSLSAEYALRVPLATVPLPYRSRAAAIECVAADPTCLLQEQRRPVFVCSRAACLLRLDHLHRSRTSRGVRPPTLSSVSRECISPRSTAGGTGSRHKACQQRSGRAEPFGQAAHDGTICLRRRKGISTAGTPAPAAGIAWQACSRARWRAAIRAGVLA